MVERPQGIGDIGSWLKNAAGDVLKGVTNITDPINEYVIKPAVREGMAASIDASSLLTWSLGTAFDTANPKHFGRTTQGKAGQSRGEFLDEFKGQFITGQRDGLQGLGTGFLPGGEAYAKSQEGIQEARPRIGSHAFTPGRTGAYPGVALGIYPEDGIIHKIISGGIDAFVIMKNPLDPFNSIPRIKAGGTGAESMVSTGKTRIVDAQEFGKYFNDLEERALGLMDDIGKPNPTGAGRTAEDLAVLDEYNRLIQPLTPTRTRPFPENSPNWDRLANTYDPSDVYNHWKSQLDDAFGDLANDAGAIRDNAPSMIRNQYTTWRESGKGTEWATKMLEGVRSGELDLQTLWKSPMFGREGLGTANRLATELLDPNATTETVFKILDEAASSFDPLVNVRNVGASQTDLWRTGAGINIKTASQRNGWRQLEVLPESLKVGKSDPAQSARNLDDLMGTFNFDFAERGQWLSRFAKDIQGTKDDLFNFLSDFSEHGVRSRLAAQTVLGTNTAVFTDDEIRVMSSWTQKLADELVNWTKNDLGQVVPLPWIDNAGSGIAPLRNSQLLASDQFLISPAFIDDVIQATGKIGAFVKAGEGVPYLGKGISAAELTSDVIKQYMSRIWKPSRVAKPSHLLRVAPEETIRALASGIFEHPMEQMLAILGRTMKSDAAGNTIAGKIPNFIKMNKKLSALEMDLLEANSYVKQANFTTNRIADLEAFEQFGGLTAKQQKLVDRIPEIKASIANIEAKLAAEPQPIWDSLIGPNSRGAKATAIGEWVPDKQNMLRSGSMQLPDRTIPAQRGAWVKGLVHELSSMADNPDYARIAAAQLDPDDLITVGNKTATIAEHVAEGTVQSPKLNPQFVKEEGVLFHGSPAPLEGNVFDERIFGDSGVGTSRNLMGRGVYLSDEPAVGASYTAKGAATKTTIDGVKVSESGMVYKIKLTPGARMLDLRQSAPDLNTILRDEVKGDFFTKFFDPAIDDLAQFDALLSDPTTSGETVMGAFRRLLVGTTDNQTTMELADEILTGVSEKLSRQYDGMVYQGGVRRGGLGKHTAYTILNTKILNIIDSAPPVIRGTGQGTIHPFTGQPIANNLDAVKLWLFQGGGRKQFEGYFENVANLKPEYQNGGWDNYGVASGKVQLMLDDIISKTGGDPILNQIISTKKYDDVRAVVRNMHTGRGEASKPLRDYLSKTFINQPHAPRMVEFYPENLPTTGGAAGNLLSHGLDKLFNFYFEDMYGRTSDAMSRVPVWKAGYWTRMEELASHLQPLEAKKLLVAAEKAGLTESRLERIQIQAALANGKGTIAGAELLAESYARRFSKDLLFDASKRTLFGKQHSLLFPFFEAFREVTGTWLKLAAKNPRIIRNTAQFAQTSQEEGWFYTDDNGRKVFEVPMTGAVARIFAGNDSTVIKNFTVGVNAVNIAGQMRPGIGPVLQVSADVMLPKNADYDWMREMISPFGDPNTESFELQSLWAPKYLKQLFAETQGGDGFWTALSKAVIGDTKKDDYFQRSFTRIMQHNANTNEANYQGADGMKRLYADSEAQALRLTTLRGLTAFAGPGAPMTTWMAHTKHGVVEVGILADDLYVRETAAVKRGEPRYKGFEGWLNFWGEQVWPYVSSLTTSNVGGQIATEEFERWARKNTGLLKEYPLLGGYLGPRDGIRNFDAWAAQMDAGRRTLVDPAISTANAQNRLGKELFRSFKEQFTAEDLKTTGTKQSIADKTIEIEKRLPGWGRPGSTVGQFASKIRDDIKELRLMIADPKASKLPIVQAVATYLTNRDAAILTAIKGNPAITQTNWMTVKSGYELRVYLATQLAPFVASQTPAFQDLYDQVLSYEFDAIES